MIDFRDPHSNPSPVFDPAVADALRDQGITRASEGAPQYWLAQAEKAALAVAREMPDGFTVDDVQERLAALGVPPPPEGRAMGAVMASLRRGGFIVSTDRFQKGRQAKSHCNPRRVWVCGTRGKGGGA